MSQDVLTTAVVGSYPQPEWLIDRDNLVNRLPPRVRAYDIWRIPPEHLEEAQEAATLAAIRDQERAGVDVISDGEIRRESYSNRVATALGGIDKERIGTHMDRTGNPAPVPLVSGPIRRERPIEVEDVKFLRANTERTIKITLPGPFTMTQQAENAYYPDDESLAMDYADAVNEEIKDLFAAGADIVQLDEPYVQARPDAARAYAVKAINRALEGVNGKTALHLCFGYAAVIKTKKPSGYSFLPELEAAAVDQVSIEAAQPGLDPAILAHLPSKEILYGVIDMSDPAIERPETVAERLREALAVVPADRLVAAPDCGMKYLARETAFGKLKAMVDGAAIVRREVAG
ncbi:MAG: 5-methyltetrahydropteroyltriglutamate--homocysteine methyltransferase [Rhodospirillaceae bacterium]|nr:5-methyltetrahydropteroyltriglutamate--homocysteine methyltransferase [Rhodospirillaceae bacterium]